MQLTKVEIKNYRSIEHLELEFEPKCRILVGINESGKTNILDALNLLDPEIVSTRRDLREAGRHEPQIREAFVRFVFDFSEEEALEIASVVTPTILAKHLNLPIISIDEVRYMLDHFCTSLQGLYIADIISAKKRFSVWALKDAKIIDDWKKVDQACPSDFLVSLDGFTDVPLKQFTLVNTLDFPDIPKNYLLDASADDITGPIFAFIKAKVESDLLSVLFWNYDESNLLPSKIDLEQFCAAPDSCTPLKRMFQLYECTDINKAVKDAQAGGVNVLTNFLHRVADKTTEHFHSTWQEYEGIKFSLGMDGPHLVAGIEDKSNHYELSQRSDGFKRFVTFLLIVSAEAATNLLRDTVLLIDEPEIGLHPTGARYLMNELIKISKNNLVVFSTHSIFMIDSRIIKRHLIVKKENEITQVAEVSDSNIQDEEVIYKSLGYSIFANLKEKNLIFEGWRDKKLFEIAISRVPSAYSGTKELKNVGHCFAEGVKQVKNITPLFEAGDRKCLILSDNDAVAKEHQKLYQEGRGFGIWKRYDEILATAAITGEDFVKESAFKDAIEVIQQKHNIPTLALTELTGAGGKVYILKRWLTANGIAANDVGKAIESIKDTIFENLKNSEVVAEYYEYLKGVLSAIESL